MDNWFKDSKSVAEGTVPPGQPIDDVSRPLFGQSVPALEPGRPGQEQAPVGDDLPGKE